MVFRYSFKYTTCSKMVTIVQQTIFFLAGVSLVVSIPASTPLDNIFGNQKVDQDALNIPQEDLNDPNDVSVLEAINSISELKEEQKTKLIAPLTQLIKNFDGTLFGSLFSYMLNMLQNPTEVATPEINSADLFKKTPLALKSLILTLQQLDDKVINDSKDEFEKILEILGNAKIATMFQRIFSILQMRQNMFPLANMGDAMLEKLPSMLADASQTGSESVQSVQNLIQNPGSVVDLMPNIPQTESPSFIKIQTPQKLGIQLPSKVPNAATHPVEALYAMKNMASRLRANPSIDLQKMKAFQQRARNLSSFKPGMLSDSQYTMTV